MGTPLGTGAIEACTHVGAPGTRSGPRGRRRVRAEHHPTRGWRRGRGRSGALPAPPAGARRRRRRRRRGRFHNQRRQGGGVTWCSRQRPRSTMPRSGRYRAIAFNSRGGGVGVGGSWRLRGSVTNSATGTVSATGSAGGPTVGASNQAAGARRGKRPFPRAADHQRRYGRRRRRRRRNAGCGGFGDGLPSIGWRRWGSQRGSGGKAAACRRPTTLELRGWWARERVREPARSDRALLIPGVGPQPRAISGRCGDPPTAARPRPLRRSGREPKRTAMPKRRQSPTASTASPTPTSLLPRARQAPAARVVRGAPRGVRQGWLAPMKRAARRGARAHRAALRAQPLARPKVFRIHRDVRFSKDKSPYKTHIGGYIAHRGRGRGPSAPAPLYVHLGVDERSSAPATT